ncbi:MAG: twin-arginine translocase subunit TatC [Candidatus Auribacterota bacterium]|jgi:sec-independent protein translocase protein TatC|nr:twin-arginine translocase subunit TatC [Candidatus Auribacterota bacterium]
MKSFDNMSSVPSSDKKQSLVEHLDELRSTIIKIAIVLIAGTAICFYIAPALLGLLKKPLIDMIQTYFPDTAQDANLLRSLHPSGAFMVAMKIAFTAGTILTLPLTTYFAGKFIMPALNDQEKKIVKCIFVAGGGLFIAGIVFCYYAALPFSLRFLWSIANWIGITNDWTIENYITFTSRFILLFGVTFETPAVILLLVFAGFLHYQTLKKFRRYVIVAIFIVAAIITPPDVITQIILALPLMILYELSVLGAYVIHKKRLKNSQLAG